MILRFAKLIFFSTILIIFAVPVLADTISVIQIDGDDEHWTVGVTAAPAEALDSSDGQVLPVTAAVYNADETAHLNKIGMNRSNTTLKIQTAVAIIYQVN